MFFIICQAAHSALFLCMKANPQAWTAWLGGSACKRESCLPLEQGPELPAGASLSAGITIGRAQHELTVQLVISDAFKFSVV